MASQLKQYESKEHASVGAVMTVTAAHRILEDGEVLEVAQAETGEAEFRRLAARANHRRNTIRQPPGEVQNSSRECPRGFAGCISSASMAGLTRCILGGMSL